MKKILLLFIFLLNTLFIIQAEDSNKELIKRYYSYLDNKDFQKAYVLSNKSIDFETYKSWYVDLDSVDISDISKINDTDYQVYVVIIENKGKNIYRYDVLFNIENSKIIMSTSKDISHTILNDEVHKYLKNAKHKYVKFNDDNTYYYFTSMFEEVGYYYVVGDKITCIKTGGNIKTFSLDYDLSKDSEITLTSSDYYDNFKYEDLIFKYYQFIEDKNFQNAYDLFSKNVSYEKYKSWYNDISIIDLSDIKKLNNHSYNLYVTTFENNGKDIFMYDVTFTVSKGKIIKTNTKDISDQIMNTKIYDLITGVDINIFNNNKIIFYSNNTYTYKSINYQENGYYKVVDNIIHCISSDNGVKSKFKLIAEDNNSNLVIKSFENNQVIFSTDREINTSIIKNDTSKVSIRFVNIPDKANFYLDKIPLNDKTGKKQVEDMNIVRSPGKYHVSVSHANNDSFSQFINVKEGISKQEFIFSYRELKLVNKLDIFKKLDKKFNAYHDDIHGTEPISIIGAVFTDNNLIIENYNEIVSLDKNYKIQSIYDSNYYNYNPLFLKANENYFLLIDRLGNMKVIEFSTGKRFETKINTENITHVELLNELIVMFFKDNTINIYKKDSSKFFNYQLLDNMASRMLIDSESNMNYYEDNSLLINNVDINKSFNHFKSKIGELDYSSDKGVIDQQLWKPIENLYLNLTYLGKDNTNNIYYSSTLGGKVRILVFDSNGYTIAHELFKLVNYSTRPFIDSDGNILFIGYIDGTAVIYTLQRHW